MVVAGREGEVAARATDEGSVVVEVAEDGEAEWVVGIVFMDGVASLSLPDWEL